MANAICLDYENEAFSADNTLISRGLLEGIILR